MTYRGRIEHGVVVLEGSPPLPEGPEVEVLPLTKPKAGEALEKLAGRARRLPADLAERHDEYRRGRDK